MHQEIVFAGFGGQGALLLGKLLTEAGMHEGKHVSWLPSYGPEMRGGTANCNVVISDEPVGSPIINESTMVIAMNRPSLEKFEVELKKDGVLFINSSIIDVEPKRKDVKLFKVPANEFASELGNLKVANMVMAGAVIAATNLVSEDSFKNVLKEKMVGKKAKFLDINLKAMEMGFNHIKK